MILIIALITVLVLGYNMYTKHMALKPMSEADVEALHKKFQEAFKNAEPKPHMELALTPKRFPSHLSLIHEQKNFLMLAWEKKSKVPSVKKHSKDIHYYATHEFLEHFKIHK